MNIRNFALAGIICGATSLLSAGCVIHESPPPREVVVVEEPPPVERVYIYEEGYPPGAYRCGDYYWYGGHRYEREVFVTQVVNVNVRERRYVNVEENRRISHEIEHEHVVQYHQQQQQHQYHTQQVQQHPQYTGSSGQPVHPVYQQQQTVKNDPNKKRDLKDKDKDKDRDRN